MEDLTNTSHYWIYRTHPCKTHLDFQCYNFWIKNLSIESQGAVFFLCINFEKVHQNFVGKFVCSVFVGSCTCFAVHRYEKNAHVLTKIKSLKSLCEFCLAARLYVKKFCSTEKLGIFPCAPFACVRILRACAFCVADYGTGDQHV